MHDLVVVLAPENRGWIVERICREIIRAAGPRATLVCGDPPRDATRVLYSHFSLLARHPLPAGARGSLLFYHPWSMEEGLDPDKFRVNETHCLDSLRRLERVITLASTFLPYLRSIGILPDRLAHVPIGSDPERFRPHRRSGRGAVGFVSAFYPRKNPDAMLRLVRSLTHRSFLLVGRGWEKFERFGELAGAPNLDYVEAEFPRYPELYARMDVLCSPSYLEGACVPILEAMLCNVVPVASRTGHSEDLIRHGENGLLFDPRREADRLPELVERAFSLEGDVRASVEPLTWDRFARGVLHELGMRTGEAGPPRRHA